MEEKQNQPASPLPQLPAEPVLAALPEPEKPKTKRNILLGVIFLVIILGALGVYNVYASPARVWQKFISRPFNPGQLIAHENITFAYKDNKEPDSNELKDNPFAGMMSKMGISVGGNFYINGSNPAGAEGSGDINYTFSSGGTSFSATISAILKGQDAYVRIGNVPFIAGAISGFNSGQPVDWIKVNFKELQDLAAEENTSGAALPNYADQVKKYQDIEAAHWQKMFTMSSVLGTEKINNINTTHFANKLDKNELKAMITEIFDYSFDEAQKMQATSTAVTAEDMSNSKAAAVDAVNTLIDRMEIKTFETWVGTSDSKLYKLKFTSSAPSLVSLVVAATEAGKDPNLAADQEKLAQAVLQKVSCEGQFDLDEQFSDYGKTQEVKAPDNALDLVQKIKDQKNQIQDQPPFPDNCPNCGANNSKLLQ